MSEDSSLKGMGGALFAGVIMIMAGAFWALEGLAGIVKGTFYVRAGHYFITSSASTWGWIHLILGLLVCLAGFGVIAGATWARVVGIALVSLSAILNFLFIPYYPFWAILIIAVDLWVIYALSVYRGGPASVTS
jgi:hypothetical protein